jgi:hypothetical protein
MKTREEYLSDIPKSYRGIARRALAGKSRKAAIRAKCLECMGYEDASAGVRDCTSKNCPLYPYRMAGATIVEP